MPIATFGLAFLAGVLSVLSPCVLPILPAVVGTAAARHRWGPAALAAGLALSFVTIGLFLATAGFAFGIDDGLPRRIGAAIMVAVGAVLLVPALQEAVAVAGSPVANWTSGRFGGGSGEGLWGQAAVGLLLGVVWSPCVGPTLGAASVLAAEGRDLPRVAATMALFGLGAATPLLVLGTISREAMLALRGRMAAAGAWGKSLLGATLVLVGVMILTGLDKHAEAVLVATMPDWLTALTTRY